MPRGQRVQPPRPTVVGDVHHTGGGQRDQPAAPATVGDVVPANAAAIGRSVAELAGRQGGVLGRAQLAALGVGRRRVDHWLATGRLVPLHRGVYAAGHGAVGPRGRAVAALLAGGEASVLSHRSAAAHWGMLPEPAIQELTLIAGRGRSRSGLIVHRSTALAGDEIRTRAGVRVTAPERTLLDVATVEPAPSLERALAEAHVLRLTSPPALRAAAQRASGHHGIAALLAALETPDAAPTRSGLEQAMLRLIRDAGLPRPQVNVTIAGHTADVAWPERHLIVEADGWAAHGHRLAFERDRARDAAHVLAGWTVLRCTWRQVTEQPLRVAAQLGALLSPAGPAGRRCAA